MNTTDQIPNRIREIFCPGPTTADLTPNPAQGAHGRDYRAFLNAGGVPLLGDALENRPDLRFALEARLDVLTDIVEAIDRHCPELALQMDASRELLIDVYRMLNQPDQI